MTVSRRRSKIRPVRPGTAVAAALLGLAALGALPRPRWAAGDPPAPEAEPDEVLAYFTTGPVPRLRIVLAPSEYAKLEQEPREYVHATLREGDKKVHEDVGVHLKGFYGSWRTIDQKPGFSVRMDKYVKGQRFHGLAKFNLNNSVSDSTYLSEFVGSEVYRAAGMVATLAAHAHVWINDRDVGTYVLKEGFDKRFLARNFADAEGNLYDGGGATDVDAELEKDAGGTGKSAKRGSRPKGAPGEPDGEDRSDLHALLAACRTADPVPRREAIAATLDMDKFLTFAALERMLCHTDGYCMNRNNYRLYFPKSGKGVFIPHGMDWLLVDAKTPLFDDPASIVARALWDDAAWQAVYRARIKELLPLFTQPEWLNRRIEAEIKRTRSALGASGGLQAGAIKSRVAARAKSLVAQLAQPAPKPLDLDKGESIRVANWRPVVEEGVPKLTQGTLGAERVLRIEAGPEGTSVGSWQTRVLLSAGRYRFEATGQTDGVVATDGSPAGGAGLRVPGGTDGARLAGTGGYKPLAVEFTVVGERKVELAVELRATKGTAFFRLGSLRLVRVE